MVHFIRDISNNANEEIFQRWAKRPFNPFATKLQFISFVMRAVMPMRSVTLIGFNIIVAKFIYGHLNCYFDVKNSLLGRKHGNSGKLCGGTSATCGKLFMHSL